MAIWGSIETTILIVAACLPTIGPVARLARERAASTILIFTGGDMLDAPKPLDPDRKAKVVRAYWYKPLEGFVSMERKPTRANSGVVDPYAMQMASAEAGQRNSWLPPTRLFRPAARGGYYSNDVGALDRSGQVQVRDNIQSGRWLGQTEYDPHGSWATVTV